MIFGSVAAAEATKDFGLNASVNTLHSHANRHVVKQYKLGKIKPFLTWRDIPKTIKRPFGTDYNLLKLIDDYCISKYLSLASYISGENLKDNEEFNTKLIEPAGKILDLMATGKFPITHSFYLKFFHILVMTDTIKLKPVDRLLVDECLSGDSKVKVDSGNPITMTTLFAMSSEGKQLPKAKSFNTTTKQFEYKQITAVAKMGVKPTFSVKTEGLNKLVCTDNHRLYTQRGYVEVKDIMLGKDCVLLDSDKGYSCITSIEPYSVQETYDITVEDNHNFVTVRSRDVSSGMVVHNCQDLSEITLDVVSKIPTKQLVLVGDRCQRLYHFLNLSDGFARYPKAKVLPLSKSFRVDASYAPQIQKFMRTNLDPTGVFKGMEHKPNPTIVTKGYLTRTNTAIIAKMIELGKEGTPYRLASDTKLKQMFKLPLALINAKAQFNQIDSDLVNLQHDINEYYSLPTSTRVSTTLFSYLKECNPLDTKLASAIKLVEKYGEDAIETVYACGEEHKKSGANLVLLTVFAAKGLTLDSVELDNDINKSVAKVLKKPIEGRSEKDRSELCLGFVAVTRHKHRLINARFLS